MKDNLTWVIRDSVLKTGGGGQTNQEEPFRKKLKSGKTRGKWLSRPCARGIGDAGPTPAGFLGGQVYWETRKATEDSPLGRPQSPRTPKVKGKSRQAQVSLARRK